MSDYKIKAMRRSIKYGKKLTAIEFINQVVKDNKISNLARQLNEGYKMMITCR